MSLVDSHAHIYLEEFDSDRDEMLDKAFALGIGKIYMPNVDHTSIDRMLEVEAKYSTQCFSMMGLHPCYVKKDFEKDLYLVEDWLNKRKFTAVGEIGTDLYWDKTFWPQQQESFKVQVALAKKHKLPIVIHCRESINETIELLEPMLDGNLTGVFHCFSGNLEQAQKIISMSFYLGYGGVATFKNGGQDKVIPNIALENILLETDSPYLAPVPHRGKRNEPAYIRLIAKRIADLYRITEEEVASKTSLNANRLFGQ